MEEENKQVVDMTNFKKLDGPKTEDFTYPLDYKEKFPKDKDLPENLIKFK